MKDKFYLPLLRYFYRITKLRPSSAPFISGDTFRTLTKFRYETESSFNPVHVQKKDIVFVKADLTEKFFTDIHPRIRFPYKLITHNSDRAITETDLKWIDSKLIVWFGQNCTVLHPKLIPIPIGLENAHFAHAGWTGWYKKKNTNKKTERIMASFKVATNRRERQECLGALANNKLVDRYHSWMPTSKYVELIKKHQAVVSPFGGGPDCHRTWEALYLGTVPIVKDTVFNRYFKSIGVPLCTIDDWNNIPTQFTYTNSEATYFPYWKRTIESHE
jgi:hypothetical protein